MSVKNVANNKPYVIAITTGTSVLASPPMPYAVGIRPATVVNVVKIIGRSLFFAPSAIF